MITLTSLMVLAALLFVKHLIADGPLQTRYQVINKGKFMHPGGLIHAGVHVALTGVCLALWAALFGVRSEDLSGGYAIFAVVLIAEYIVHYCVDWSKCRLDSRFRWSSVAAGSQGEYLCIHDVKFFYAFLADQTMHSLTYVAIVYWVGVG